jgi:hypothetical protein
MMDTRSLRRLVKTIESEGGSFVPTDHFMQVDLPDALVSMADTVRENSDALYALLFPPKRWPRKKRSTCAICKSGAGCRKRQAIKEYQLCPVCSHWCASHFLAESHSVAGCMWRLGHTSSDMVRCQCPGWPPPVEPVKTRRKNIQPQENSMPLFSESEVCAMRERHLQKQAALEGERPKTKAQILVDLVCADPSYTVAELSEGSGHSKSWVRKHLRAAGLKAAPGIRQRNPESEAAR